MPKIYVFLLELRMNSSLTYLQFNIQAYNFLQVYGPPLCGIPAAGLEGIKETGSV